MDESIFSKKTKELEKIAQEDWEQFLNITENEPWWNLTGYVTLQEALYWVAFREKPDVPMIFCDEDDQRFCHNKVLSQFSYGKKYTYKIGKKAYLVEYRNPPRYPESLFCIETKNGKRVTIIDLDSLTEEKKRTLLANKKFKAFLTLYEKQQKKLDEWEEEISNIVEPYQASLFSKLATGELKAYGQYGDDITPENMFDDPRGSSFTDTYTEIPKSSWRLDSIDWGGSCLSESQPSYYYIHLNPKELVKFFPAPTWVSEIVETYNGTPIKKKKLEKRGRKRTGLWDEFHVEVTKYLLQHRALPKKQSELVKHCQQWFSDTFGEEPPESEIKEKVSLYYKKLDT